MTAFSLDDPLFATYVVAATLIILKAVSMSWLTVVRMMKENGGFRSPGGHPEDAVQPESGPRRSSRPTTGSIASAASSRTTSRACPISWSRR